MAAIASTLTVGRARRGIDLAARVLLFGSVGILATLVALPLLGFRTLVVRSGSMEPAIHTGDIVVSKIVAPQEVGVGDVVTFKDPSRENILVTHRVVDAQVKETQISFVTKGDANGGTEDWSVDRSGTVGKVVFRLPRAGYVVSWATQPMVRAGLMIGAALILAGVALRWIWGRGG